MIVQIPRHYTEDIVINANAPTTIFRFLSAQNDNSIFDQWQRSDIPIYVKGGSSSHTQVILKEFEAGTIVLKPGGPVSTAPILIKIKGIASPSYGFEIVEN